MVGNKEQLLMSVIIPVYNTENYINRCVESVLCQGIDENNYEIIIVNDGSIDNSISVIEELRKNTNIKLINQCHQGISVARNEGIRNAKGEYILFVDSDDMLIRGKLKSLLETAIRSNADLVFADYIETTEKDKSTINETVNNCNKELWEGTGLDFFLHVYDGISFAWRALYSRSFLNNNRLAFIPGICFEDIPFTLECILHANRCIKCKASFYLYIHRDNSIVTKVDKHKLYDINVVINYLWGVKKQRNNSKEFMERMTDLLFNTFSFYSWYMISNKQLFDERQDVLRDLFIKVPDIYFDNSIKQRIISFLFRYNPCFYIQFRRWVDILIIWLKQLFNNENEAVKCYCASI